MHHLNMLLITFIPPLLSRAAQHTIHQHVDEKFGHLYVETDFLLKTCQKNFILFIGIDEKS